MSMPVPIEQDRLLARLSELGRIGEDTLGGRTRLALTMQDKLGRDLVVGWLKEAGAAVHVDRIGNIYGLLEGDIRSPPLMVGSHIDTVTRGGAYDGCYGVLAGIEVLDALARRDAGLSRSFVVAAFTNEEGVRFAPDLLGSRVLAGALPLEEALSITDSDALTVADELRRIGYAGDACPQDFIPYAFLELHIEQGPVLEQTQAQIGVVEAVQGHSWWKVIIEGTANHAGTTPMCLRRDAGLAAMSVAQILTERARAHRSPALATIGTFQLEPNAINVVPGKATFTLDLRDRSDDALCEADRVLEEELRSLEHAGFRVSARPLSRHSSVQFDSGLCALLESEAEALGLRTLRMGSGASHDAQMMASLCPTGMIFVPSHRGISHNPREHTEPSALAQGAQVLYRVVQRLLVVDGDA